MWNKLRSTIVWLHQPEHVARFQQYFGILPIKNNVSDSKSSIDNDPLNQNNNNNNKLNRRTRDGTRKISLADDIYHRIEGEKALYDESVIDECLEEFKHSASKTNTEKVSTNNDYQITSWFWYYFFQFGAALGNEIFYILFFPIW